MVDSGWLANPEALRRAQFDLKLPFTLPLSEVREEAVEKLVCRKLLRLIPGKRMVCAALWKEREVVVKFYLDRRNGGRHFKRELAGVRVLTAAGIKTPNLLFHGTVSAGRLPLIIFAEIKPAATLVDLWFSQDEKQLRFKLLERVCAVIAGHHVAGLLQSDIHWSNFLFSNDDLFTIDGDAVESKNAGRALGRKSSLANLALFLAEPYPGIDEHLERLWQSYCGCRDWSIEPRELERLRVQIGGHRRKKVDKFVTKSLRNCTAFVARREAGFYTLLDRTYQGGDLERLLHHPDELLADGEILKAGNSATVVRINIDGRDLVVKRYNIKNFTHAFRRCFRPSRAFVSWKMGQRLNWWRIATPKPVAMLEKRSFGLRSTAYFISEYVAGSSAYDHIRRPDISAAELEKWLRQFAVLLTQLRNLGLSHGDFKATNFLCGSDSKLYLLDLDAMRSWARPESGFKVAVSRDYRRLLANWHDVPELELSFQRIIEKLLL